MNRSRTSACTCLAFAGAALALLTASATAQAGAARPGIDWPQFRGIGASGVADTQELPSSWDVEEGTNVRWRTAIPGLAHASPVVWGDRVFVVTAVPEGVEPELKVGLYGAGDSADDMVEHAFVMMCLDRDDGHVRWKRTALEAVPKFKRHTKATHLNSTPVTDGEHVVGLFGAQGLYCWDFDGELLWKVELGALDVGPHDHLDLEWGFASSPIIADGKVIVQADVKKDAFLAAYDVKTGEQVWRVARDDVPGWCTPTAHAGPDGMQILVNGCKHMGAYRLADGEEIWRMAGGGGIPVPAPVVAGDVVLLTSNHRPLERSHPQRPVFAVELTARGELDIPSENEPGEHVAWMQTRRGNYMQTPLVYRGLAYFGYDNGVLTVLDAKTGEERYRERLGDGTTGFSPSPVAGDGKVYFTSEQGTVFVLKAGPEFEVLAENEMGEVCMATPAISEGALVFRTRGHVVAVGGE